MSKKTPTTKTTKTVKKEDASEYLPRKIQTRPTIAIYEARLWVSVNQYLTSDESYQEEHKKDMANHNSDLSEAIREAFLNRYDIKLLNQDHRLINLEAFPPTWDESRNY